MVCRVFRKSGGAKKFPSNPNHTRTLNPYSLELSPSMVPPPPMMHLGDPSAHFNFLSGSRNYIINPSERLFRDAASTSLNVINLPIMQPHFNHPPPPPPPVAAAAAAGFTISGLNLNLGGGAVSTTATTQTHLLSAHTVTQMNHDFSSNMVTPAAHGVEYGADITNANSHANRFMSIDNCMDLDTYWPSY